jgi:light-regulated signal transduction histidine kinase (bacteriophytochrome)
MRSNEELSQFAYVASHDLQEPLRKIQTFADRLVHAPAGLEDQRQSWAEKIYESSGRMSLLVKSLLEFSRLVRPEESFEKVDLHKVVADVIKDYDLIIEEKKASVACGVLPSINASELQMHQLFQNLISNALKFTHPGKNPELTIQCTTIGSGEIQLFVPNAKTADRYFHITFSDNGIGFDNQYAEHIFEIFKRLHGRTEYKGSGIGLALCKRIVSNHHGYIIAESEEGQGSTFHIFLPARAVAEEAPMIKYQAPIINDQSR